MNASSPAATGSKLEHDDYTGAPTVSLIESESRYPGARPFTLTELVSLAETSPSPMMRSHAVKVAYMQGAKDGTEKANRTLEAL